MTTNCIIEGQSAMGYKDVYCKTLIIPEGITHITNGAFRNYYGLEEVFFPSTLVEIGARAFENCTSLKFISLPFSVEKIGIYVFAQCVNLIHADLLYTQIRTIPECTFYNCKSIKGIFLPDEVEKISKHTFLGCNNLMFYNTPKELKIYEDFPCSKHLKTIWIPDKVIHIYDLEKYSFEHLKIVLCQKQYEKFQNILPQSAEIIIDSDMHYKQYTCRMEDLSNMNTILDKLITLLGNDVVDSFVDKKAMEEMIHCIDNYPEKLQIERINFSVVNKEYDVTTSVCFDRNGKYTYKQTELGNIKNVLGNGEIDKIIWKDFEVLCATNYTIYKNQEFNPRSKKFWHIRIQYVNGKSFEYKSSYFDIEGYHIFHDCFGKYIDAPPQNAEETFTIVGEW